MSRRLLIALGGNAIKKSDEAGTTQEQFQNVEVTHRQIVRLLQRSGEDDRIAVTHGNGPYVGNLLVQQEEASGLVPAQTLILTDVEHAMLDFGKPTQRPIRKCRSRRRRGTSPRATSSQEA